MARKDKDKEPAPCSSTGITVLPKPRLKAKYQDLKICRKAP